MIDFVDLCPVPRCETPSSQEQADYFAAAYRKASVYIIQIRRVLGPEPKGAKLRIVTFSYYDPLVTVFCYYDEDLPDSEAYAYRCESRGPRYWDHAARNQLAAAGYAPDPLVIELHYCDPLQKVGWCNIEVLPLPDGQTAVIATELRGNPAMSITNAAERVATSACQPLGIDPTKLVWIEYYDYPDPVKPTEPRTFDLVTFGKITPNRNPMFRNPSWRPMRDADWQELGLSPRRYTKAT